MYTESDLQQLCDQAPEIEVYKAIEFLGGIIYYTGHDMRKGRYSTTEERKAKETLDDAQKDIERLVDATTRFGVQEPRAWVDVPTGAQALNGGQERVKGPTDDYWRWYKWWDGWWRARDRAEQDRISQEAIDGKDVSQYRPEGDWRLLPAGRT